MNRMLRAGMMVWCVLGGVMAAAWFGITGMEGGTIHHYPVTVRLWLNDSFVGGIQPVMGAIQPDGTPTPALALLAAGNDLIFVDDDAPRCPVWSVAWVRPAPGTAPDARVYNATIRCDGVSVTHTATPDTPVTLEDALVRFGP